MDSTPSTSGAALRSTDNSAASPVKDIVPSTSSTLSALEAKAAQAAKRRAADAERKRRKRAADAEFRQREAAALRERRANDSERREREATAMRERRAADPQLRERAAAAVRERRANDGERREREAANIRKRRAADSTLRENEAAAKRRRREDADVRAREAEYARRRREADPEAVRARQRQAQARFREKGGAASRFKRDFLDHSFGHSCAVCDRLWFDNNLTTVGNIRNVTHQQNCLRVLWSAFVLDAEGAAAVGGTSTGNTKNVNRDSSNNGAGSSESQFGGFVAARPIDDDNAVGNGDGGAGFVVARVIEVVDSIDDVVDEASLERFRTYLVCNSCKDSMIRGVVPSMCVAYGYRLGKHQTNKLIPTIQAGRKGSNQDLQSAAAVQPTRGRRHAPAHTVRRCSGNIFRSRGTQVRIRATDRGVQCKERVFSYDVGCQTTSPGGVEVACSRKQRRRHKHKWQPPEAFHGGAQYSAKRSVEPGGSSSHASPN